METIDVVRVAEAEPEPQSRFRLLVEAMIGALAALTVLTGVQTLTTQTAAPAGVPTDVRAALTTSGRDVAAAGRPVSGSGAAPAGGSSVSQRITVTVTPGPLFAQVTPDPSPSRGAPSLGSVDVVDARGGTTGWSLVVQARLSSGAPVPAGMFVLTPSCDARLESSAPGAAAGPAEQDLAATVTLCVKDAQLGPHGSTGGVYAVTADVEARGDQSRDLVDEVVLTTGVL